MLEEFLFVVAHSTRTQLALLCAVVFPIGIWIVGEHLTGNLEFSGPLAQLTEIVREKLMHRYDKAALTSLFVFLALAVKSYLKARKRLFQL